jgi:hypothetical protein
LRENREGTALKQGSSPRTQLLKWDRWTAPRVIAAGAWIGLTSLWGLGFIYVAAAAESIELDIPELQPLRGPLLRRTALNSLLAAGLFALGPFGVWIFRRRAKWLVVALSILGAGLLVAGWYLARST